VKKILWLLVAGFVSTGCSKSKQDVCDHQCAAIVAAECPAGGSLSECVARCEDSRDGRSQCLAEDAAFRDCFAASSIFCDADTGKPVIRECDFEANDLHDCLTAYGEE
jgi:hypothetical protein